jgi:hypothetical protein
LPPSYVGHSASPTGSKVTDQPTLEIFRKTVDNEVVGHKKPLGVWSAGAACVALLSSLAGLLLVSLVILGSPRGLSAQNGSPDPAVIKSHLRAASVAGRKTLQGLESLTADEDVPIPPQVRKDATETYGWIRAARSGMDLKKQLDKYPDPVMELAYKRVAEASDRVRGVVDRAGWGGGRASADYLNLAIPSMKRALQLMDQAIVLFP